MLSADTSDHPSDDELRLNPFAPKGNLLVNNLLANIYIYIYIYIFFFFFFFFFCVCVCV